MMENPIKMYDLGVLVPLFLETTISVALLGTKRFRFFGGHTCASDFPKSPTNFGNLLDNLRPFNASPGPRTF